nr:hypothetical protein [Tanacetum cinerariifolium]
MVNTRNNNLITNTPTPTDPIQAALATIQETLANIQDEVRTHTTEIANLKRGEGTVQLRNGELTGQPRTHPEPNTPYGKLIKIEFPKKVQLASMHMFDAPWEHFKVEVVMRFGVLYDDLIVELKNLKETGSVQTYQEDFKVLLNRMDLPELVDVRLKPKVRTPMRMFQATTLNETYGLSRMKEATNTILKPSGQLYSIEVICGDDFDNYIDGDDETYQDCVGDMVGVTDSPQITLNALSGLNSYQTMRVRGRVGKQVVHILIDCSNIHNFLDIHTAKKLGCRLAKTTHVQVLVANGQRMMRTSVCHDLKWSFQNEVFTSDVMLLPLGGCKMVLDIQWLATFRDMQCNFKKLIMKFNHKGRQLVLRGMNNTHMESVGSVYAEVEQVLTQFDGVFEVPKDLPPQRSHDHQTLLMPNTPPINVRPYRHPPNQKDAIEVKDKFPIPVIEEIIDESNGSVVFSKLDLSFENQSLPLIKPCASLDYHLGLSFCSKIIGSPTWHFMKVVEKVNGFYPLDFELLAGERKPRKGQNHIKTGQKREAWRSQEKSSNSSQESKKKLKKIQVEGPKDSDSHIEEIDLSFNLDDSMSPSIEEDDDDSERDIPILKELLDNYSLSLLEIESFHFDISSSYRPPAKPPDGNTGILNIKMMGDISDQKVPIPNLMITRVSSQEKSPDLLPHQGLEAF